MGVSDWPTITKVSTPAIVAVYYSPRGAFSFRRPSLLLGALAAHTHTPAAGAHATDRSYSSFLSHYSARNDSQKLCCCRKTQMERQKASSRRVGGTFGRAARESSMALGMRVGLFLERLAMNSKKLIKCHLDLLLQKPRARARKAQ